MPVTIRSHSNDILIAYDHSDLQLIAIVYVRSSACLTTWICLLAQVQGMHAMQLVAHGSVGTGQLPGLKNPTNRPMASEIRWPIPPVRWVPPEPDSVP
jgi:hypothetical protein